MATKLAPGQVSDLDPYKFMAVIGKRVILLGSKTGRRLLTCQYGCGSGPGLSPGEFRQLSPIPRPPSTADRFRDS
jgi:hypothetical protein